jgi:hypothetical protein
MFDGSPAPDIEFISCPQIRPRVEICEQLDARRKILLRIERAMYLRFVVADIDEDSGKELGVFHVVANLRDDGKLYPHEEEQHDLIRQWFNNHLEKPTRFTASKPPFYRKKSKAISWFKDTAQEHLARVRTLVAILQNYGISVRMLKTKRVRYVVYEDEYQIVAEPFAGEQY